MLLTVLALASAAPPAAPSVPEASPPKQPSVTVTEETPPPEAPPRKRIEIRRDNVDLAGAGRLVFVADSAAVMKVLPSTGGTSLVGDAPGGGEIVFDAAGRPIACTTEHSGISEAAENEVCRQIMARARFVKAPGYALPFEAGRLAFTMRVHRVMAPAHPIRFVPAGKGYGLAILDTGKPGLAGCSILDNRFGVADSVAVCKAWIAAGRPGLAGKPAPKSIGARKPALRRPSAGGDIAVVSVPLSTDASEVKLEERMIWKNVDITYPQISYRGMTMLSRMDGTLRSTFDMMDYPRLALIEEVGGRVMILVGFEREGAPVSCRPITSSGTAYLDNQTCVKAMTQLHFDFAPDLPPINGTRYWTTSVRWLIPSELSN